MSWKTWTGRLVDPFNLTVDDIFIEDIATSLSQINRYNGHTNFPYSVAQHSAILSYVVGEELAPAALMHDSAEAYLQDIVETHKGQTYFRIKGEFVPYRNVEHVAEAVIFDRFNIPLDHLAYIDPYDKAIVANEMEALKPADAGRTQKIAGVHIIPWTAAQAKTAFLERFQALNIDPYERRM